MKKFIASVLVISIAMMGTLSYNAAAKGPNDKKGNGPRIENHGNRPSGNHGDNAFRPGNKPGNNHANVGHGNIGHGHATPAPRPAAVRPAPRPEPRPAPRPRYRRPAGYRAARIVGDAIVTAAAITAANAIIGAIVNALPPYYTEILINGRVFYLADNILYRPVVINGVPCFEIVNNRYIY